MLLTVNGLPLIKSMIDNPFERVRSLSVEHSVEVFTIDSSTLAHLVGHVRLEFRVVLVLVPHHLHFQLLEGRYLS